MGQPHATRRWTLKARASFRIGHTGLPKLLGGTSHLRHPSLYHRGARGVFGPRSVSTSGGRRRRLFSPALVDHLGISENAADYLLDRRPDLPCIDRSRVSVIMAGTVAAGPVRPTPILTLGHKPEHPSVGAARHHDRVCLSDRSIAVSTLGALSVSAPSAPASWTKLSHRLRNTGSYWLRRLDAAVDRARDREAGLATPSGGYRTLSRKRYQ